jgi:hypothetical protein
MALTSDEIFEIANAVCDELAARRRTKKAAHSRPKVPDTPKRAAMRRAVRERARALGMIVRE